MGVSFMGLYHDPTGNGYKRATDMLVWGEGQVNYLSSNIQRLLSNKHQFIILAEFETTAIIGGQGSKFLTVYVKLVCHHSFIGEKTNKKPVSKKYWFVLP